jgi:hypothetical protein
VKNFQKMPSDAPSRQSEPESVNWIEFSRDSAFTFGTFIRLERFTIKIFEDRRALWFGQSDDTRLFYPFGIKGKGYIVPHEQQRKLLRWTQWRVQLPLIFAAFYFFPLIGLWGPSLSASGRLEAGIWALAVVALLLAALASAALADRAAHAWLLRGCAALDRFPTRSEQRASSGHVAQSFANRHFAPLPVRLLCLAVGFATVVLGLVRGDYWLMLSGLLLAAVFALNVLKECCSRLHFWLLAEAAPSKGGDP